MTTNPNACDYRTGKILGQGSYATVREAVRVLPSNSDIYQGKIRGETNIQSIYDWKRGADHK
jgi:hypothetical protein